MARREWGIWIFRFVAIFVFVATLLPLFRGEHWLLRLFDFPRMQIFSLGLMVLGFSLSKFKSSSTFERILAGLVFLSVVTQGVQIFPYTPLARNTVLATPSGEGHIRLLTANVLQDNRDAGALLKVIALARPNIVLLTEVDRWWIDQMKGLEQDFPYTVKHPLTNYYGMALYSKLKLIQPEVRFLVKEDIPSIFTTVQLSNGQTISFYGVHPEPPGTKKPGGGLRGSGPRDVELVLLARELKKRGGPAIVAGDFNDVAWSHTTRLFKRTGELLDPRVGRGFFNTFHAKYPFLRYPLDHFFHTEEFTLATLQRLPKIGSDHFPIMLALDLKPLAAALQEPQAPKPKDAQEASEIITESPRE